MPAFDPEAPLPGAPDPWAGSEMPARRPGPPYAMTEMIAAEPALAERLVGRMQGDPALGQETEEWAHLQYFARAAATPTFIITAADRDLSRATEVAVAAKAVGRRVAARRR